ncbi:zinc finger Y-chromosomal protein 2-like [Zophobas morio]|uniref:zinc finger Y-chromosomal protein 2-like n=1 Tax=Zophobas morio TaxID=2755281 RepID=UPI00308296E2
MWIIDVVTNNSTPSINFENYLGVLFLLPLGILLGIVDNMSTLEYCQGITTRWRSSWQNVHNCKLCPYFTTSLFFMVNHVRRHRSSLEEFTCDNAKIEAYYCKDCDYKTELTLLFKQHIYKHHGLKRESEKVFSSEDFRIQTYVCQQCDFETNLSLNWLQHTFTCTRNKENLQNVNFAKEKITNNSDFKQSDEMPWCYCTECSYKTKLQKYLKRHIKNTHSNKRLHIDEDDIEWHKCQKCPFKTKAKANLKKHIKNLHLKDEDVKWYKCNVCSFKTKHKKSLNVHVGIKHLDEEKIKWYECANCPYRAKLPSHLRNHVIFQHLDQEKIKWYDCANCPYRNLGKKNASILPQCDKTV